MLIKLIPPSQAESARNPLLMLVFDCRGEDLHRKRAKGKLQGS